MCGIAGIFAFHGAAPEPRRRELLKMSEHMRRRGPDGAGEWWSADRRIAFAHRRLAIIDPVDRAAQPMTSACGRYAVVFNGEIYNYRELRSGLVARGRRLRTESDTEALLELFAEQGGKAISLLRGMFAFALFDTQDQVLWLARDPYGIKPLYCANDGWTFRFASQVKSLRAGDGVSGDLEPAGLVGFHLFGHVPEPFTLFREIRAIPPGTLVKVDAQGMHDPLTYESVSRVLADAPSISAPDLAAALRPALLDSVSHHLVADVEVGAFLSAGVDSGAILGLMRDAGQQRIRTITLRYDEFAGTAEDEAPLAAMVASRYSAEHTERHVSREEFRTDLPHILDCMDQPSIDGINSWFASKAMKERGIKVAVSGLGGDELLAGYPSFADIPRWVSRAGFLSSIPMLGRLARRAGTRLFPNLAQTNPKAPAFLEYTSDYASAYFLKRALFLPHDLETVLPHDVLRDGLERLVPVSLIEKSTAPSPSDSIRHVAALESCNYMRNQLLRDADWAGMSHGIEIRVPLVDITLLKHVAPLIARLSPGKGKVALANCPQLPLPDEIVRRPKTGFGIPAWQWLAGESGMSKGVASRKWSRHVLAETMKAAA